VEFADNAIGWHSVTWNNHLSNNR